MSEPKWDNNDDHKQHTDHQTSFSILPQNYHNPKEQRSSANEVNVRWSSGESDASSSSNRHFSSCLYDGDSTSASIPHPNEWSMCEKPIIQECKDEFQLSHSRYDESETQQVNLEFYNQPTYSKPDISYDQAYDNIPNLDSEHQVLGLHWSQVSEYFQSCAYYFPESS